MTHETFSHETYLSPFTWRYGSDTMRVIWSDKNKRLLWRQIWVALAQAQAGANLVTSEQVQDLINHQNDINITRAHEIEAEIHHDLMAEVRTFAEQCPIGGGIIHLGATSMDIEDNADALRLRDAVDLIITKAAEVLQILAELIQHEADHVCMAFTHIQPAEPTTIGYRLANYAQDLLEDFTALTHVRGRIRGKGLKGAVGTSASYAELLRDSGITPRELEALVMDALDLEAFPVAHQTYPRRQDWEIVNALASVAMTIYRVAFDIRLLQSPPFGEWSEPFAKRQVGSSAMPFKRNPINAENMDSIARYVATLPRVMWDNAAHALLERTLDDSANRRIVLPQAFLAVDELLERSKKVLSDLRLNEKAIQRNVQVYGVFAATERVLMEGVRKGGDRQELHEIIRERSLEAWDVVQRGWENPLLKLLLEDERLSALMSEDRIRELMQAEEHIGDAPERARGMATLIKETLSGA